MRFPPPRPRWKAIGFLPAACLPMTRFRVILIRLHRMLFNLGQEYFDCSKCGANAAKVKTESLAHAFRHGRWPHARSHFSSVICLEEKPKITTIIRACPKQNVPYSWRSFERPKKSMVVKISKDQFNLKVQICPLQPSIAKPCLRCGVWLCDKLVWRDPNQWNETSLKLKTISKHPRKHVQLPLWWYILYI